MKTNYWEHNVLSVSVLPSYKAVQRFSSIRGFAFSHAYYNDDYYIYTAGEPNFDKLVDCRVYPRDYGGQIKLGQPMLHKVFAGLLTGKVINTTCKVEHYKTRFVLSLLNDKAIIDDLQADEAGADLLRKLRNGEL